jgi:hypothetical protein
MSLEHDAMRFDASRYAVAQARVKSAPLDLTEADFDQLAIVSKGLETEGREALRHAQLALVQTHRPVTTKVKTYKFTDQTLEVIATAVANLVKEALAKPKAEIEALKTRVLELEADKAARENHVPTTHD